ncbi:MAG: 6,7-dimethyl-8-ribityllumazine synthase [Acidobacteriota bacterium]|jgi:6,7-dimethyl-8-ribityllumazine synthase|nr:6,7-dimethyl-8-ribityllumazine synthase [Bryobacteraceae bacterium CoA2 C42]MCA2964469.1 6,7-dimethyl-8-ribityllumazine synthase [Acidobacteriaceae bacterium]
MQHTEIEGALAGQGLRIGIVVARFNSLVTENLLAGALAGLRRHGVAPNAVTVVKVPGSWELPLTLATLAATKKFDGLIALGAVIRGDTPHFDYVAGEAAKGIGSAMMQAEIPIVFGVLTTNTLEQALDRAGAKSGNKGYDAAQTVIEMANLLRELRA